MDGAEMEDAAMSEACWNVAGFDEEKEEEEEEGAWDVRESGAETGTVGVSGLISTRNEKNKTEKDKLHLVTRFLGAVEEGASKMDLL